MSEQMSKSSMHPTITAFLLDRIAEDEEFAGSTEWAEERFRERTRALVECSVKRRIVLCNSTPDPHSASEYCPECNTLYLLALPYADHPDYREEWRP